LIDRTVAAGRELARRAPRAPFGFGGRRRCPLDGRGSPPRRALHRAAFLLLCSFLAACANVAPGDAGSPEPVPPPSSAAPPPTLPPAAASHPEPMAAPLAAPAASANVPPAPSAPAAVPPDSPHPHAQEIADIRRHHVDRMNERLNVPPAVLQESCRFESDIATRPPAGRVALTFDDGPEPGQTEHILDVLQRQGVSATFFMIGEKMQRYPALVARVRSQRGATIANHSWDHPNFHDLAVAAQEDQIRRGGALVPPDGEWPLFRFPFGNSSCEANAFAHQRGYRIAGWHVDSCDWAFERNGSVDEQEARSCGVEAGFTHDYAGHVLAAVRAHGGGIILMHEIHPNTVRQLERIVAQLKAEGYAFGSLRDPDFEASLR
jgi:peptidoglycan/xylan/chitin deacetylase (PgdA/CDA1 family)